MAARGAAALVSLGAIPMCSAWLSCACCVHFRYVVHFISTLPSTSSCDVAAPALDVLRFQFGWLCLHVPCMNVNPPFDRRHLAEVQKNGQ